MKASTKPPTTPNIPPFPEDKRRATGKTDATTKRTSANVVEKWDELQVAASQITEDVKPLKLEEIVELLMSEVMSKVETEIVDANPVKVESQKLTVEKSDPERSRIEKEDTAPRREVHHEVLNVVPVTSNKTPTKKNVTSPVSKTSARQSRSVKPASSQKITPSSAVNRSATKGQQKSTASTTKRAIPSKKAEPSKVDMKVVQQPKAETKMKSGETVQPSKPLPKQNSAKDLVKMDSKKSVISENEKVETQAAPVEPQPIAESARAKTLTRKPSNLKMVVTNGKNDEHSTKNMEKARQSIISEATQKEKMDAPVKSNLKVDPKKPNSKNSEQKKGSATTKRAG